jgi:hypothetical protein
MCESYSLSGHFVNTHKAQILTFQLSGNAYFALDNAEIWINSTALSAWIASNNSFTPSRGGTPYSSRSSSAHGTSHSRRSSIDAPSPFSVPSPYDADIIIASDGNPMLPPASHYRKRALSLGDSEDDSRPTRPTQRLLKLEKQPDLKVELDGKVKEVEAGKVGRRQWAVRKKEITTELKALKDNGLAGARVNGRRKSDRPSGDTSLVNKDPDMLVPTAVDNDEGPSNPIVLGDHFERMLLPFLK